MKQRELEAAGLQWTCVQALAGVTGEAAATAQRKMDQTGEVPVVCTPRGQAQSVRLMLDADWLEALTDAQLADAITQAQGG